MLESRGFSRRSGIASMRYCRIPATVTGRDSKTDAVRAISTRDSPFPRVTKRSRREAAVATKQVKPRPSLQPASRRGVPEGRRLERVAVQYAYSEAQSPRGRSSQSVEGLETAFGAARRLTGRAARRRGRAARHQFGGQHARRWCLGGG